MTEAVQRLGLLPSQFLTRCSACCGTLYKSIHDDHQNSNANSNAQRFYRFTHICFATLLTPIPSTDSRDSVRQPQDPSWALASPKLFNFDYNITLSIQHRFGWILRFRKLHSTPHNFSFSSFFVEMWWSDRLQILVNTSITLCDGKSQPAPPCPRLLV